MDSLTLPLSWSGEENSCRSPNRKWRPVNVVTRLLSRSANENTQGSDNCSGGEVLKLMFTHSEESVNFRAIS